MIHKQICIIIVGLLGGALNQLDNQIYGQNYNSQDNQYDQNNYLSGENKFSTFRNSNINSNFNLNDYSNTNDYRYGQNTGQFNQFNQDYNRGPVIYNNDDYAERDFDTNLNTKGNCPKFWVSYNQDSTNDYNNRGIASYNDICFRFFISLKTRNEALKVCQTYNVDLANIDSVKKHAFIIKHLINHENNNENRYLISAKLINNQWINNDNTNLVNENIYPQELNEPYGEYLTYSYSHTQNRWGFKPTPQNEPHLFICEGHSSKLQHYIYATRNLDFGIDIADKHFIPMGPVFIRQPLDTVFDITKKNISSGVTLSCLATGYPTPTYEWYKQEFVNDNLTSYKIEPLQSNKYTISGGNLIIHEPKKITDRGNYHCKATNKFGSVLSNTVELSFGYILEFNLKRQGERGDMNFGKALYCDPPQHYPGVKYYWAREYFPNFVEEDRRVFVSDDGALYFSALETIDRGKYSCNVQSKVSDTGRNGPFFDLQVNPHSNYQILLFPNTFPKSFPEAPIAGEQVRLECMAYGYPVPTYNWTRLNGDMPKNAYFTSYNRVLIIPNITIQDKGTYECTVKNDRAKLSKRLELVVQSYPVFNIPLENMVMDIKSELNWLCEVIAYPNANYTWYKNGERLDMESLQEQDRDRYNIQDNILNIKYLDPTRDNGMYQCKATNQLKGVYSSAQLKVITLKPTFKKYPMESETYATENGNTTIKCNPEAAPKPKIVWKKDNIIIGNGGRRRILQDGNLVISPTNRDDEGIYTCVASNSYGSAESKGRLIVLQEPRFILRLPQQIQTEINMNISLLCEVYYDDLLDIAFIWTHNGIPMHDFMYNERIVIDGGNLTLINLTLPDSGQYECIAKSAVGQISSKTMLNIHGPPGPPGGIKVLNIQKSTAGLQWTDGNNNGRYIEYYNVYGRTNWNETWHLIAEYIKGKEIGRYNGRKEATVTGLTPWSVYEFKVVAVNSLGLGTESKPSPLYSTDSDKPYIAPKNIGGGGGKIGDLTITWDALKPDEQNGKGIHYKVFWRRHEGESEFQTEVLKKAGNVNSAVVNVPAMYYYTKYDVKVQAINDVGLGPESHIHTIYSAEDMPQVAPQLIVARSYNSTSLNVTWKAINLSRDTIRGKLIGHRLKYWKKDNREEDSVYYLSRSTLNHALIVGLSPDTYYFVKVIAYNSAGEGPESERYLERTYRKAPQKPPSSVHVYGVNPSTVRVVWRYVAPSQEEEPLIGYKIRVWESDQDMATANDTIIYVGDKLESYVEGLSPGKAYKMRVLAFSNGGDGRMSSPTLNFQMGDASAFRSSAGKLALSMMVFILCTIPLSNQLLTRKND